MTGNDIVDIKLAAVESNWKRTGFLEKIFTPQEQHYIQNAAQPEQLIWRLWSMKESGYKIYTRQNGGRFFAPQKFSCTLLNKTSGFIQYDNNRYQTNTILNRDYIYSTAAETAIANPDFINECFFLPQSKYQQQFIYKKIIDRYNTVAGKAKKNLTVAKDKNGIPFLHCGSMQIPVSITHHGRFAAFTIH